MAAQIPSWVRKVKNPGKKIGYVGLGVLTGSLIAGGSAFAASQITSGDIANQTIQSWDIAAGGVGQSEIRSAGVDGSEVENQSLHSWDLAPNSVGASEVKRGSIDHSELTNGGVQEQDLAKGVQEKLNAKGGAGDGAPNFSKYELIGRTADRATVAAGDTASITTKCVTSWNQTAFSGGAKVTSGDASALTINQSYPSGVHEVQGSEHEGNEAGTWHANSWTVQVTNTGDTSVAVQPYVVCGVVK